MADRDDLQTLLDAIADLSERAGDAILGHYRRLDTGQVAVERKADRTPVTAADRDAEAIILPKLAELAPAIPAISEEEASIGASPKLKASRRFWLVDPIDGTKEFLSQNGEFTVNIALIEDRKPILGAVHLPALGITYAGQVGAGAWMRHRGEQRQAIQTRRQPKDGAIILASRSHGDDAALTAFLANEHVAAHHAAGSSLKFCRIAEGLADIYPRLGRTMEWDTAAGHAVLQAADGLVTTLDGAPLGYGKPDFENPHFVARGRGPA